MLHTVILAIWCLVPGSPGDAKCLHQAAAAGDLGRVKNLISEGVDVNAKDNDGKTALHHAADKGHKDVALFLVAKGADVDARDKRPRTPLHYAVRSGNRHLAEFLIAKGADVNARGSVARYTPLHYALMFGHKDISELLIANGADVNAKEAWGWTPLHYAAQNGYRSLAERLIAEDADVNAPDKSGSIPLHYAVKYGRKDTVALLLTKNAKADAKDSRRRTPLHYAVIYDRKHSAELLAARGAEVDAKDNCDYTPLHYAYMRGDSHFVRFLMRKGADPRIISITKGPEPADCEPEEDLQALCGVRRTDMRGDPSKPRIERVTRSFAVDISDISLYPAPEGYKYLRVGNLKPLSTAGAPQLPMKTFVIPLPHGSAVAGVEVVEGRFRKLKGSHKVIPAEKATPDGKQYNPSDKVYRLQTFFPGMLVRCQVGKDSKHTYAFVRFFPAQYVPKEETLAIVTGARIALYYKPPERVAPPKDAEKDAPQQGELPRKMIPSTDAECVIMCPDACKSAAARLGRFHEREGITSVVVTVESIDTAYSPVEDPPFPGYANRELSGWDTIVNYDYALAKRIIAYLRDQPAHPRLEYVTIFGDAELVPASLFCFLTLGDLAPEPKHFWVATDLFYASPDYDYVPNYKVGRLPVRGTSEGVRMVRKIERWYEHANWEWFGSVYFHAGMEEKRHYAYFAREFDNDLTKRLLGGMRTSGSFLSQGGFTKPALESVLKKGNMGFVHHASHGKVSGIKAGYDPIAYDWLDANEIMKHGAVDKLPIVLSSACYSARWYHEHLSEKAVDASFLSFGEAVLKSEAGGIAYFGASSITHDVIDFYFDNGKVIVSKLAHSAALPHYGIMKSYHDGADTLGRLASDAVFTFLSENDLDYSRNRLWLVGFTHLGDPALKIPVKPGRRRKVQKQAVSVEPPRTGKQPADRRQGQKVDLDQTKLQSPEEER